MQRCEGPVRPPARQNSSMGIPDPGPQSQCHKLRPTARFAKSSAYMMLFDQNLKLMSRHQFQQLRKYSVMVSQGLVPPINTVRWWYIKLYQFEITEPFLFFFMGQQWRQTTFLCSVLIKNTHEHFSAFVGIVRVGCQIRYL